MHAISLLNSWLERNAVIGHRTRQIALLRVVEALLNGIKLALTHLARARPGNAFIKHHIKAVDCLLGNPQLHRDRRGIYAALCSMLLAHAERPVIVVDWCGCELGRELLILKAALPIGGRAISLYEEVHPLRRYNNPRTHRLFLHRFHQMVPAYCIPIIVTDAGFRGPWFRDVEALGWDWTGRIRNSIKYLNPDTPRWCDIRSLYRNPTPRIRHLGVLSLSPRHREQFRLYLVRAYQRRPGRPRKRKLYSSNDKLYRRLHRAPWLLATSLSHHRGAGNLIKRTYIRRMEIEETFRDLKSHRWGFALRYAQTKNPRRLEMLLLIALLATFVLWLLGLATKGHRSERHFQANTERRRSVLSTVFLGRKLLRNRRFKITPDELACSLQSLKSLVKIHSALA